MIPGKDSEVILEMERLYGGHAVPHLPVGYDYAQTVRELKSAYTENFLAEYLGYAERRSLKKLENGTVPNHLIGEALFVLYVETFKKKPPMYNLQKLGIPEGVKTAEFHAYLKQHDKRRA